MKKIIFSLFINFLLLFSSFSFEKLEIFYKQVNLKQYSFYVTNKNFCPYQISINLELPGNMVSTDSLPYCGIAPADSKDYYLFSILTDEITKDFKFQYSQKYSIGNPNLIPDVDYNYVLPFNENEAFKLTQGYSGRFSHRGWTKFSLDFGMSMGKDICAARDGVVVDIKSDSDRGGRYYSYRNLANYITIYHEDGTFAKYMHLKLNGSLVKVGDQVKKGQLIGFSGNTGWTRGPHLHFMVFRANETFYETLPTYFIGEKSNLLVLEQYKYYFSYHNRKFDSFDTAKIGPNEDKHTEENNYIEEVDGINFGGL